MSRDDVLDHISIFQRKLEKYANSGETDKVLFYIHKLKYLPITVRHLEATGVGRTVNSLRHHGGMVGSKARDLVNKWKKMVSAEESEEEAEEEDEEEEVDIERRTDGDSGVALRDRNGDDMEDDEDEEDDDRLQIEENGSESNVPVPDYRPSGSNSYEYGDESPGGEDNSYNPVTSQRDYQLNTNAPSADYHPSSLGVNNSRCSSPDEATSGWEDESPAAPSDRRNESSSSSKSSSKKSSKEDKHKKKDKHRDKDKDKSKNSSGILEKEKEKEKKKEHKHKAKHKEKDKDREEKKSKSKSKHKEKERHEGRPKEKKYEENGEKKSDKEKKKNMVNGYGPLSDDADSSTGSRSFSAKYEAEAEAERRDVDDKLREKSSSSSSHRKEERSREKNSKEGSQERVSSESEIEMRDVKIKDSGKDKEKNRHHSKHSSSSSSSSSSKKDKSKQDLKNHDNQREDDSKKKKSKRSKDDDNDFGAALMGFDSPSKKKKKKKKKDRKERDSSDDEQQPSSSKSRKRPLSDDEEMPDIKKPKLLEASPQKLPKLPQSLGSSSLEFPLLPEINPNYKPLPRVPQKLENLASNTKTEDDVFKIMLQQKGKRSKMYSGRVTGLTHVPSLFDIAMRTAMENIDALNLRIGQHLAFDIIKPILERATPQQLLHIEDIVPHLLEDTDLIWENLCKKDFRNKTLEDMETWRELWLRCSDERDKKLKSLTANWQQKFVSKAEPKRQTKLAFVNDTVKVPKSVARAQAKYGTAVPSTSAAKPSKAAEVLARKTAMQNAQRAEKAAAPPRPTAAKNKKVAPLMAKTRQFYKKAFRR